MHRPNIDINCHRCLLSFESHIAHRQLSQSGQLNPHLQHTSWFHMFTYKRFHVLLNSLFKVLCNFPSRYLFAIGYTAVFSLSWSLPANLGCTLKQPDSSTLQFAYQSLDSYGSSTRYGKSPCQRDLRRSTNTMHCNIHVASPTRYTTVGLDAELFPFRSPLLGESRLVSFPPLNYMLKFSG
jgi:hypothetical protein